MNKGVVCRVCFHNKNGKCSLGNTEPVNKADECWTYRNKSDNVYVAEHSPADAGRRF